MNDKEIVNLKAIRNKYKEAQGKTDKELESYELCSELLSELFLNKLLLANNETNS